MTKISFFFLLFIAGCNTVPKEPKLNTINDSKSQTDKIIQVEVTTAGGMQGVIAYCKMTQDSVITDYTLHMDSSKNYSIKKVNNDKDWADLTGKINLKEFKKAVDGISMLPVDGVDTEIKIKTNDEELVRVNADKDATWLYIREYINKYFKQ